ncbi:YbaK/EbsC family protein [Microbulbifer sp. MLAF003]|nr:YbaK/EbsC family protein [Microbulbifer sp. MLAF003]WHI50788.1 YbaK/EbsC family protein [Microbulbifer sp. MLAF003]
MKYLKWNEGTEMTIAAKLSQYLNDQSVDYHLVQHPHTRTSRESAHAAHVREDQVAKAIMLQDNDGYVMVVIPASSSLDMRAVHMETGRNGLEMVAENELGSIFPDCELGALPQLARLMASPPCWTAASATRRPFISRPVTTKNLWKWTDHNSPSSLSAATQPT